MVFFQKMENKDLTTASFELLYKTHFNNFKRFAKTYVEQEDIAEDIVVDSFLSYWEHRATVHSKNIPAYILTAVKNRCLNHLKHLKIKNKAESSLYELHTWETQVKIQTLNACDPEKLLAKELQSLINNAIDTLPQKTSKIFCMSRYEHLPHKEIAQMLHISTKTVEYHIGQAIARLRILLQDYLILILFYFFSLFV